MLRLLTLNISGHNVSALSPPSFGPREKYVAIADLVRRHAPHIVAFQEVPQSGDLGATLAAALADSAHGLAYQLAASAESHCGLCQVFVQERLRATGGKAVGPVALCKIPLPLPLAPGGKADSSSSSKLPVGEGGAAAGAAAAPAAAAAGGGMAATEAAAATGGGAAAAAPCTDVLAAGDAPATSVPELRAYPYYLYVAGCHLEPFGDGAGIRLQQIDAVLREVPPRACFVLAGDTNMRVRENAAVEARGLTEAWQQVGAPQAHAYSWNTRVNRYHGHDSREYVARYDRIYVRGLEAISYRLVANEPLSSAGDYLSDHFGLLCELRVPPGPVASQPPDRAAAAQAAAKRPLLSPHAARAASGVHPPVRLFE